MLSYYFSLEAVFQGMAKINPTEKQNQCRNSGDIEACASVKTYRRENAKLQLQIAKIDLNYKLQVLA